MPRTVNAPPPMQAVFDRAEEHLGRYFQDRRDDPGRGAIEISGERYVLIRGASLSIEFFDVVKGLFNHSEQEAAGIAGRVLFDIAHALGKADALHFHQSMGLSDPLSKLSAGPVYFAHAGWAFVDIAKESNPEPNENYYLLYDHPYSFEADAWIRAGKSTQFPVCSMSAGYSSGWCGESFGMPLVATEVSCRARGDDACRFIMAPPDRIEAHVSRYLEREPARTKKTPDQEIWKSFRRDWSREALLEKSSRESERAYRDLFELSPDAIAVWNADGIFQAANQAAAMLLGYEKAEDLLGRPWDDFIAPEDRAARSETLQKIQETGGVNESEFSLQRKDGSRVFVQSRIRATLDDAGLPAQTIIIVRDITARKAMETTLRDSEKAYRDLFELSPDGIIAWDANGVIQTANSAAATIAGYDKSEDLVGQKWLDLINPDDRPAIVEKVGKVQASGGVTESEFGLIRKDGSHTFADGRLHVVLDGPGSSAQNISIVRDITERKQAERALRVMNRTLRTLSAVDSSLVRAPSEQELLDEMCRVCVELGGYRLIAIGFAEHDEARTVRPVAWAGEHTEHIEKANISWADNERGRGPTGTAIRTGQAQFVQNIEANPAMEPWRADLAGLGFKSSVALPLKNGSEVFGVMTLLAGEADAFGPEEVDLLKALADDLAYGVQARRDRAGRDTAIAALDTALKSTVQAVAGAIEVHDVYTAGHQRHVADLAVAIGHELSLTDSRIEGLFLAGLIHDVGKLVVPAEFLSKPGKLTPLEFQVIQTHVQAGYDIIKGVDFPWPIGQAILQHHERLDGSGYPNRLKGEAISIEGRVLGVADVVDAMQSHRPYRPALGLDAALAEIEQGKGRLYDPAVVDACVVLFRQKGFRFA